MIDRGGVARSLFLGAGPRSLREGLRGNGKSVPDGNGKTVPQTPEKRTVSSGKTGPQTPEKPFLRNGEAAPPETPRDSLMAAPRLLS